MTIYKDYKISNFLDMKEAKLNNCSVRFRSKDGNTFRLNAKELLMLTPGKSMLSKDKKVSIQQISFDKVVITINDSRMIYTDFHTFREVFRKKLKDAGGYQEQIDEINKLIFHEELFSYLNHRLGKFYGFRTYMEERFPKESKEKYGFNFDRLFWEYRDVIESDNVPGEIIHFEKTIFRRKQNLWGEYYTYPITIHNRRKRVDFSVKAYVCSMLELKVGA